MSKSQKILVVIYIVLMTIICVIRVPWEMNILFGKSFHYNYSLGFHPAWQPPKHNQHMIDAKLKLADQEKMVYEIEGMTFRGLKPSIEQKVDWKILFFEYFICTLVCEITYFFMEEMKDPNTRAILKHVGIDLVKPQIKK